MSRTFGIADLPKLNRDDGPYTYDALRDTVLVARSDGSFILRGCDDRGGRDAQPVEHFLLAVAARYQCDREWVADLFNWLECAMTEGAEQ
jgi:hypothetical protein